MSDDGPMTGRSILAREMAYAAFGWTDEEFCDDEDDGDPIDRLHFLQMADVALRAAQPDLAADNWSLVLRLNAARDRATRAEAALDQEREWSQGLLAERNVALEQADKLVAALAAVAAVATFIDDDVIASRIRDAIAQAGAEA